MSIMCKGPGKFKVQYYGQGKMGLGKKVLYILEEIIALQCIVCMS